MKTEKDAIKMQDYEVLCDYLTKNFEALQHSSSSGTDLEFPDFDLMPFDYLEFAEQELTHGTTAARINCVSNLKRATECEMDTFIHILGLSNILKSFPRKLDFFSKTGLLSSRSLEKLNRIRNKMEHEYADPNLAEIDAYFDLASGFIHSLEGYIFMLGSHKEQEWERKDIPDKVALRIKLNQTPPQITFQIAGGRTITFDAKHFDTYLQGLEIYFLICRATALLSADYVIYKLNRNKSPNTGGRYSR